MKADLAADENIEEAIAFAYKHNQNNETGSSYCAKRRESIAEEYKESVKNGTLACVFDQKGIAGLLSWYEDSEKKTVDCGMLINPAAGSYYDRRRKLFLQHETVTNCGNLELQTKGNESYPMKGDTSKRRTKYD